jgi:branched-subunit amino acid ABC-type transport system permease component
MQSYTNSTSPAKYWFKHIAYGIGLWLAATSIAMLISLSRIRGLAAGHGTYIMLGPFKCMYVHKATTAGGGYTLTVTLAIGLLVVLFICIVAELLLAWPFRRGPQPKLPTDV